VGPDPAGSEIICMLGSSSVIKPRMLINFWRRMDPDLDTDPKSLFLTKIINHLTRFKHLPMF
jgi:hypothetical protein